MTVDDKLIDKLAKLSSLEIKVFNSSFFLFNSLIIILAATIYPLFYKTLKASSKSKVPS